jgi:carotenoid cleavage dioxygenase-like enzyme
VVFLRFGDSDKEDMAAQFGQNPRRNDDSEVVGEWSKQELEKVKPIWASASEMEYELQVEGCIPDELQGTFFRNGPGLMEVYGTPLVHPIDGDGMASEMSLSI